MAALFGKKTTPTSKGRGSDRSVGEDKKKKVSKTEPEVVEQKKTDSSVSLSDKMSSDGSDAYKILKNIYVSEKASMLGALNQYVFKVFKDANKRQVKTNVEKLFNVKVRNVKILNMPEKRKDIGRHPGFRSGFKKAIVALEKGFTIDQAK